MKVVKVVDQRRRALVGVITLGCRSKM
jgi:hypothetical protein